MKDCCLETMKRVIEETIWNMKYAKFEKPEHHIQDLEYALSMLNNPKK